MCLEGVIAAPLKDFRGRRLARWVYRLLARLAESRARDWCETFLVLRGRYPGYDRQRPRVGGGTRVSAVTSFAHKSLGRAHWGLVRGYWQGCRAFGENARRSLYRGGQAAGSRSNPARRSMC